jgi:hypothetical protein
MVRREGSIMRAFLKEIRKFVNNHQGYILLAILILLVLK